ncbi:MAG: T9SS type A sorting domain-containing protein, partial [Bacteroidetes bacterium]|nr:T9SS type A sorting domain-containing protein [Bacteroidota bacterium]
FVFVTVLLGTCDAQIFSQNFNSSTTLTDYYNSSPSTNQFRTIDATTGATVSVSTNALVMTRGTSGNAYAERNVDFSPIPSGMIFQFSFSVSGGGAATSAILIAVGTDVANGIAAPTNSNIFARFAISTTATSGEFIIRDIKNSTTGTNTYTGTHTITWALNNTGSIQTYTAPDGSSETIADGKADIWVSNTREFNDISVDSPTQTLARFKFYTNNWANATVFTIDDIVINNESALPVELVSFTSNVNENKVTLNWSTATEVNNYGFEVQRASTKLGTSWEKIGFVQGAGNSNSPKNYSFTDKPTGGKEFQYRLKQIDFNGAFEYSEITTAILENVSEFKLEQNYPNPFNPMTRISYTLPVRTSVKLRVYDLLAQVIAELVNGIQEAGRYDVTFDGSNFPSGAYFYKLEAGSYIEVKKLLLVK